MYYIVGLGNPGERYQNTRHNIGWLVLDALVTDVRLPQPVQSAQYSGWVSQGQWKGENITVLYPDTFMNNSGSAVKKLLPASESNQLVVLHDDIDLPLGEVRVAFGRGSGGHNGISSIINNLGTKDFVRVRVGVAKTAFWPWQQDKIRRPAGGGALEKFVLGEFTRREQESLYEAVKIASAATLATIEKGYVVAMNEYN